MPQAAVITVNDRSTPTPIAHNFAPSAGDSALRFFRESGPVPVGEPTLALRSRQSGARYYKRITLSVPVVVSETINGISVPKVVRTGFVDCTFRFDDTSSEQERANLVGMFANALASSQTTVNPYLVKLEAIYG